MRRLKLKGHFCATLGCRNQIVREHSLILTPHPQIVRMANHWGEFMKVNRLQPGKMLQIFSGNDIRHATKWLYATQTFPRDLSFFSNHDIVAISRFEIKQHVVIKDAHLQVIWQFSSISHAYDVKYSVLASSCSNIQ